MQHAPLHLCVDFPAVAAQHVSTWPIVGPWHQKGLALLIGSFGTLSVLLFARPEAEPVKVWGWGVEALCHELEMACLGAFVGEAPCWLSVLQVWNLIAGHLLSITIVILVIQVMGATPVAR